MQQDFIDSKQSLLSHDFIDSVTSFSDLHLQLRPTVIEGTSDDFHDTERPRSSQVKLQSVAENNPNNEGKEIDFIKIRQMCESDTSSDINCTPQAFKQHRIQSWPSINQNMGRELTEIYRATRLTGLPNALKARRCLPTTLDLT